MAIVNPTEKLDTGLGPLASLKDDPFQYETIMFPSEVGPASRHPYYMSFYINIPDNSKYKATNSAGAAPTGEAAKSEIQKHQTAAAGSTLSTNITVGGTTLGFGRKTVRTGICIRLFMPETLSWSFSQGYKTANLSDIPGAAALSGGVGAGKAIADAFAGGGGFKDVLANLLGSGNEKAIGAALPFAEGALTSFLGDRELATSAFGVIVNPQIDVLYTAPELRTFSFEFLMAPRSQKEAAEVARIVYLFKFHAAPEILNDGTGFGRYFVPPSEFDIKFSVNTLGKISTCVLEDLTVDYAPNGTAFYVDDAPAFTRMTLRFRELEFVTKELVREGF